jgi:hypothetical protein
MCVCVCTRVCIHECVSLMCAEGFGVGVGGEERESHTQRESDPHIRESQKKKSSKRESRTAGQREKYVTKQYHLQQNSTTCNKTVLHVTKQYHVSQNNNHRSQNRFTPAEPAVSLQIPGHSLT